MTIDTIVMDLRREAGEDYVGLWKVFRLLRDASPTGRTTAEEALSVVAMVLADPGMQIGQFANSTFHAWPEAGDERLARLKRELQALKREPSLGEVAWLVRD